MRKANINKDNPVWIMYALERDSTASCAIRDLKTGAWRPYTDADRELSQEALEDSGLKRQSIRHFTRYEIGDCPCGPVYRIYCSRDGVYSDWFYLVSPPENMEFPEVKSGYWHKATDEDWDLVLNQSNLHRRNASGRKEATAETWVDQEKKFAKAGLHDAWEQEWKDYVNMTYALSF